jgi:hypothetical protein
VSTRSIIFSATSASGQRTMFASIASNVTWGGGGKGLVVRDKLRSR